MFFDSVFVFTVGVCYVMQNHLVLSGSLTVLLFYNTSVGVECWGQPVLTS